MLDPEHIDVCGELMMATGDEVTVTVTEVLVAVQPLLAVTVTAYVPEAVMFTDCVVAALLHKYDVADEDVSVTLPPEQKVVAPDGVMVAVGGVSIDTVMSLLVALQPLAVT